MVDVTKSNVVQTKLTKNIQGSTNKEGLEDQGVTWTQMPGLSSSLTSASWIAPFACSILPDLRNVAADINHKSLNILFSLAVRLFPFVIRCADGRAGGGGGGGDLVADLSS
jgi:hypothetical protein